MTAITPTVGRVVEFIDVQRDPLRVRAAQIAGVNDDGTVNLGTLTPEGIAENRTNVPLVQPDESEPPHGAKCYCRWMPYQVGQAAKAEQAEVSVQQQVDALHAKVEEMYTEFCQHRRETTDVNPAGMQRPGDLADGGAPNNEPTNDEKPAEANTAEQPA